MNEANVKITHTKSFDVPFSAALVVIHSVLQRYQPAHGDKWKAIDWREHNEHASDHARAAYYSSQAADTEAVEKQFKELAHAATRSLMALQRFLIQQTGAQAPASSEPTSPAPPTTPSPTPGHRD